MAPQGNGEYYIGVIHTAITLPDELASILVKKFRDFRLQALKEADGKAFGRTNLSREQRRSEDSEDSHRGELINPRNFWISCFYASDGLHGNVFRNAADPPPASKDIADLKLNADDEKIIREGEWMALSSGHGPIARSDWQLLRLGEGDFYSDEAEYRFHMANLYLLESHRGAKDDNQNKLFTRLCHTSFEFFENFTYRHSKQFPAWLRLRGTVAPEAPGTKLFDIYKSFNYHFLSWLPQVTAMIVNGGRPESWPEVPENPAFYSHCIFPAFERLCKIEQDGTVLLLTNGFTERKGWKSSRL